MNEQQIRKEERIKALKEILEWGVCQYNHYSDSSSDYWNGKADLAHSLCVHVKSLID